MASDAKDDEYKLQHEIQKTHVQILDSAGKDEFDCAAALKARLNFDKIARKFLRKYDCEAKMMKLGAKEKINAQGFAKVFEKEFIPQFSEKIFDIIYDYNHNKGNKGKKGGKNLLAVSENGDEKQGDNGKEEERKISRLDCQRFIKSSKDVRKHIREKSLVPLESVFKATQFSDISDSVTKVSFEEFSSVFEAKLGKNQCKQAFDLMKDKNNQISIVAYNNFREKGVHKLLGDAGKDDDDDDNADNGDNGDNADNGNNDADADADAANDDKDA